MSPVKRQGFDNETVLSMYREWGVVPKDSRDDNHNRTPADLSAYQLVEPGDVVFNKMKAWSGSVAVSTYRGIVSPDYLVCRVRHDLVSARYLHHLLRSRPMFEEYRRRSTGVRPSQWRLYWEELRLLDLTLPPLRTQRRLAAYLDHETLRIDTLVQDHLRLQELLLERYRSARMHLLAGSPSRDTRVESGVPWSPWMSGESGWARTRLKQACALQRGHDLPTQDRRDGPYPVVSSGGTIATHAESRANGPGVVTGRYGTVGEVYFVEGPYWPLNTALYVVDFRGNDPRYVFHLLSATPLDAESEKSAVGGINRGVVHQLPVALAPRGAQAGIAREIDEERAAHDQLARSLSSQNKLLMERRQALITAAVTGQLDVGSAA